MRPNTKKLDKGKKSFSQKPLSPQEAILNEKKLLRKKIKELKEEMSLPERNAISMVTLAKSEAEPEFKYARTFLIYFSLPDEIQTEAFIDKWHSLGKRVVLPLVVGDDLVLKEYDPKKLQEGYKGIYEPTEDSATVEPSEIDLAIIPGVAFDYKGNRMGRGKGFYDRFLPKLTCPVWGVAFPFQMVKEIPCEEFDKPVDKVFFINE